jgi:hypothetical protein
MPGNTPGTGRPPSEIRQAARLLFTERLPVLAKIVDNEESKDSDRIAAMKVLADTGGVDKIALTVDEQPETQLTPELLSQLWVQIKRIKTVEELEHRLVGAAKEQAGGE